MTNAEILQATDEEIAWYLIQNGAVLSAETALRDPLDHILWFKLNNPNATPKQVEAHRAKWKGAT